MLAVFTLNRDLSEVTHKIVPIVFGKFQAIHALEIAWRLHSLFSLIYFTIQHGPKVIQNIATSNPQNII